MGINYGEIICEAVETISESLLQGLKFDSTIKCTITDASEADKGIYQVSNGSATFTAYSSEKYKVNTNVYVVIPQSDYDNEKIIVGKVAKKDEISYTYVAPLDNILPIIKPNNILTSDNLTSSKSLIANNGYEKIDDEVIINRDEGISFINLFNWLQDIGETKPFITSPATTDSQEVTLLFLVSPSAKSYIGFTRFGLSGEFRSWLLSTGCLYGDYGIEVKLIFENSTVTKIYTRTEDNGTIQYSGPIDLITYNRTTRILKLASADMIGNPYTFETFFRQEKLFDITDLGNIVGIEVNFYQEPGTFLKEDKQTLIAYYDEDLLTYLPPNLFVLNVDFSLGFDIRDQEGEFVLVYSDTNYYTTKDSKTLYLRWMHETEDGKKIPIDETKFEYSANGKGIVTIENTTIPVYIRWYKQYLGEPSDNIGGVNWKRIESLGDDGLTCSTGDLNIEADAESFKAVILWNYELVEVEEGLPERFENLGTIYRSNIYNFENTVDGYFDRIEGAILDAIDKNVKDENSDLLKALKKLEDAIATGDTEAIKNAYIEVLNERFRSEAYISLDLSEGNGNYLLYDELNNLIDKALAKKVYKITPYFNFAKLTSQLSIDNIAKKTTDNTLLASWVITPNLNMLKNTTEKATANEVSYSYSINSHLDSSLTSTVINYTATITGIERPAMNQVQVGDYTIDIAAGTYPDTEFTAVQELTFGLAGTLGATCTLVLDFDDDKVAFTTGAGNESRNISLYVYDENNREITNELKNNNNFTVAWDWYQKTSGEHLVISKNGILNNELKFSNSISSNSNLSMNDIYILRATLKGWKNSGSETAYDLIAYLPIPIRSNNNYSHISGADKIVYLSDGTIKWYDNEYLLYSNGNVLNDIHWNIIKTTMAVMPDEVQKPAPPADDAIDEVKLAYEENLKKYNKYLGEKRKYEYALDLLNNGNNLPILKDNILLPVPFYLDEIALTPFAVLGGVLNIETETFTPHWTQPILIIQNKYFSSSINNWDGKTVLIDVDNGEVLASRIGAGRKNSSNQFSGVILGDWRNSNLGYTGTGLFGFRDGEVSFGLQDNGTAFIGGAGGSLLRFDGNNGVITSSGYLNNNATDSVIKTDGTGLYLDFATAKIVASKKYLLEDNKPAIFRHITINAGDTDYPLIIGSNDSVDNDTRFKVAWDGSVEATGKILAESGYFKGDVIVNNQTLISSDGTIKTNFINLKGIEVTNGTKTTFKVNEDGTVEVNGKITMGTGSSISWDKITDGETEVNNILSTKGYLDTDGVNGILSEKEYVTESSLNNKGFLTNTDVEGKINSLVDGGWSGGSFIDKDSIYTDNYFAKDKLSLMYLNGAGIGFYYNNIFRIGLILRHFSNAYTYSYLLCGIQDPGIFGKYFYGNDHHVVMGYGTDSSNGIYLGALTMTSGIDVINSNNGEYVVLRLQGVGMLVQDVYFGYGGNPPSGTAPENGYVYFYLYELV